MKSHQFLIIIVCFDYITMAMAPRGLRPPWPPGPPYTTMFLSPPSQSHHYYNDDTFISLKISIISAILQVFKKKLKNGQWRHLWTVLSKLLQTWQEKFVEVMIFSWPGCSTLMLLLLWAEKEQLKKVVELKKKTQLKNNYGKIKVKKNKTEKEVVTKNWNSFLRLFFFFYNDDW